jgi:dihydroorotate dehydrogenase electron transfer subunit
VKQIEAKIVSNRPVAPLWRELVLAWDKAAGRPEPGQFMTIRASPRYDPLLRRPLAYAGAAIDGSSVSALYQVRGSATLLLSELAPGSVVDVLGPLGRPFPKPEDGERAILAAGGVGLGPVLYLARELGGKPARRSGKATERPTLVLGFRDAASVPDVEFPEGTHLCTDDGSAGVRGFPTELIARNVPQGERVRLYGCGPAPMLASLAALAAERGWAASLSAEQWMACGVGACMGCALMRADGQGYLRACADGPVFDGGAIDWAVEAKR